MATKTMYIELKPDKSPKTDFNTFYTDTDKLENAGLILDNKTVVVDFDKDVHLAEKILNEYPTKAIKTTRGYHLYFTIPDDLQISNSTHTTTVLGNIVDYKTGYNDKKAYAIVKLNGINRLKVGSAEQKALLPKILYPTKTNIDIINLEEGQRNDSLFKHLSNCVPYFQSSEALVSLAHHINSYMINPIDTKEIVSVVNSVINRANTSPDIFDNIKGNQKLNLFKFAEYVIKEFEIINYEKRLYFKENGSYINDDDLLLSNILYKGFTLTGQQDKELLHQTRKLAPLIQSHSSLPISLNNGYQIENGIVSLGYGNFTPFNLNVAYNVNAYDEHVDYFLNWLVSYDKELRLLLEEILGHIIMTSSFPQHAFFFVGSEGKNGKSTFFDMVSNFCGGLSENLALEEMIKIENLSVLKDKLVNCGDDIDNGHLPSSRTFKNLTSGNTLMVRQLYKAPTPFKNIATLLFSCNAMPSFKDKSGGIDRRVKIIPCNNRVKHIDLGLNAKLSSDNAKSYILNLALKGMDRIINNGGMMTESQLSTKYTEDYIIESDSVRSFIKNREENNISIVDVDSAIVYIHYTMFCEKEGLKPYSKNKFTRGMSTLGYDNKSRSLNGRTIRSYEKKG